MASSTYKQYDPVFTAAPGRGQAHLYVPERGSKRKPGNSPLLRSIRGRIMSARVGANGICTMVGQ